MDRDRRFSSREFAESAKRRWKFCSVERRPVARLDKSRDRGTRVARSNEFLPSRDCAIVLDRDSRTRLMDSSLDMRLVDLESLSTVLRSRFLDNRSLVSCKPLLDKRSRLCDRGSTDFRDIGALNSDTFVRWLLIAGFVTFSCSAIGLLTKGFKFGQASTLKIISPIIFATSNFLKSVHNFWEN